MLGTIASWFASKNFTNGFVKCLQVVASFYDSLFMLGQMFMGGLTKNPTE